MALTITQLANGVPCRLRVNTEIGKALLDRRLGKQFGHQACHRRLSLIFALNKLLIACLEECPS